MSVYFWFNACDHLPTIPEIPKREVQTPSMKNLKIDDILQKKKITFQWRMFATADFYRGRHWREGAT